MRTQKEPPQRYVKINRLVPLSTAWPSFTSGSFTPLEMMACCLAAGLDFRIVSVGFDAPLEFLTG